MIQVNYIHWIAFAIFLVLMLFIDLGILNRKSHKVSIKEAILSSIVWISLAIIFNIGIFIFGGHVKEGDSYRESAARELVEELGICRDLTEAEIEDPPGRRVPIARGIDYSNAYQKQMCAMGALLPLLVSNKSSQ